MDIVVAVFALIVAIGCVAAIFWSSRKDKKKEQGD